jgi:LPS-assembly protein
MHKNMPHYILIILLFLGSAASASPSLDDAELLEWVTDKNLRCEGFYKPIEFKVNLDLRDTKLSSDKISVYQEGCSKLTGNVEVMQQRSRIIADKASFCRLGAKLTNISLDGNIKYFSEDKYFWAQHGGITFNADNTKSFNLDEVLYRIKVSRFNANLPGRGKALSVEKLKDDNYILKNVTYTTCAPNSKAWHIAAKELYIDQKNETAEASSVKLEVGDLPIMYLPHLDFPLTNKRKSGFLLPVIGYSNLGDFDLNFPYYWNIAPNYDTTLYPHIYSKRGFMLGSELRVLTDDSVGKFNASIMPHDAAFDEFILQNEVANPSLQGLSSTRYSLSFDDEIRIMENTKINIDYQKVSDPYYLQDFSRSFALATENQLLREGSIVYEKDDLMLRGMLQSYQTLNPINQSSVDPVYARLPQLFASQAYDLPLDSKFNILGQFDYFRWPNDALNQPQGARYYLNPVVEMPFKNDYSNTFFKFQVFENNYQLNNRVQGTGYTIVDQNLSFNTTTPMFSMDTSLAFDRAYDGYWQTLEPQLFYLYAPYHNQSYYPAFDSGYMIFTADELFRFNRFSGFDRIGDANQVAYALRSRLFTSDSGRELASFVVGQIYYFTDRRVQLCYAASGDCADSQSVLGYVSPLAQESPIAARTDINLSKSWTVHSNYVWDPFTHATNNGDISLYYKPEPRDMLGFGYNYLISGNIIEVSNMAAQNNALHQVTAQYAWSLDDYWSSLGVYSYNISENYSMMGIFGVQYDTCCWAARLLVGETFNSLNQENLTPQYNKSIYLQILFKGLGSLANSDPTSILQNYLPGYENPFRH